MKFLTVLLAMLALSPLRADDTSSFDYHILALSWSPNWCALEGDARGEEQCGTDLGWSLHGLWPQNERGYPENCRTRAPDPTHRESAAMANIMGSGGLAWYQWKKHGRCSGLAGRDYYRLSRRAYDSVTRPALLRQVEEPLRLPARVIEEAFLEANPALTGNGVRVTCRADHVQEVRICLTRDLEPRDCGRDVRADCTLQDAIFLPVR